MCSYTNIPLSELLLTTGGIPDTGAGSIPDGAGGGGGGTAKGTPPPSLPIRLSNASHSAAKLSPSCFFKHTQKGKNKKS